MNVSVQPEDFGRNLKIWFWEENFGVSRHYMRLLDNQTWERTEVPDGVLAPEPSMILPRMIADELARQILGRSSNMADELMEVLRVERARVDKLIDYVITPPTEITEVRHG